MITKNQKIEALANYLGVEFVEQVITGKIVAVKKEEG